MPTSPTQGPAFNYANEIGKLKRQIKKVSTQISQQKRQNTKLVKKVTEQIDEKHWKDIADTLDHHETCSKLQDDLWIARTQIPTKCYFNEYQKEENRTEYFRKQCLENFKNHFDEEKRLDGDANPEKFEWRECSICVRSYTKKKARAPILMNCGHTTCFECIGNLPMELNGAIKCPHCRVESTNIDKKKKRFGLTNNETIRELCD